MRDRFIALCGLVGTGGDAPSLWLALDAMYHRPPRAYHSLDHVAECLVVLDAAPPGPFDVIAVEFAVWLHDVVYEPTASNNESRSASVAAMFLRELRAPASMGEAVERMILATRHNAPPSQHDERVLVDIDLSILGADPERYVRYAHQIREEYSYVDDTAFAHGRRVFLTTMLARPELFSTPFARDRFEQRARKNMCAELSRLE